MADSTGAAPHYPSRRELRRIEAEAEARGEGPLSHDEVVQRALARAHEAQPDAAQTGSVQSDAAHTESAHTESAHTESAHTESAQTESAHAEDASAGAVLTETASAPVVGPATAGIPLGHGFVTPVSRRYRRLKAAETGDEKDYGRAGRNLPAAIGVGVVLGGSVLASLLFYPPSFLIIVLAGVCLATWELADALSRSGANVSRLPVIIASACMIIATYFGGQEALWVAFTGGAGAVLLFALLEVRADNAVKDVCLSLFALTYVGLMASFVVHILTLEDGRFLVICFIALVVGSDIGGYIAGVLFGKHPIAPQISPKKSWEGFAGSALMSTGVAVGMAYWVFDAPVWTGVVLGVLIPAFATLGDFSESMIKRDLKLKDMGSLLPGHGGIMDRLDSILPTAPVALILFGILPGFVT